MRRPSLNRLHLYIASVSATGLTLLVLPGFGGYRGVLDEPARFFLLASFVLVGEIFPIRVPYRNEMQDVTTSTAFVFAILIDLGTGPAAIAQAAGSLFADVRDRKVWWKTVFNLAQYTIAVFASGAVLHTVAGQPGFHEPGAFTLRTGLGVVLAAAVFFVMNTELIAIALALASGLPVLRHLRYELSFYLFTSTVLFCLSPVIVIVAERGLLFVPLLLAPLAAAYRSARLSTEKDHRAAHDPLTDLPNRMRLGERINESIVEDPDMPFAVMIIDLDHFKEVNDTLGHQVGDDLLRQIGGRLRAGLRSSDLVARLGGDEFAVLASVEDEGELRAVAASIENALGKPYVLEDLTVNVEASIGAARYPQDGDEMSAILRRADIAMYTAKEARLGLAIYDQSTDPHNAQRLGLLGELRSAIESGELTLHYQPQVDLATGKVMSVEALVRWEHPQRGLLMPDEFIPLAEHTGVMRPLTSNVLDMALGECATLRRMGMDVDVAVNLSVRNLYEESLLPEIRAALERWELPPSALTLEITESMVMADAGRVIPVLTRLSELGLTLSVDDFGTGYSSLSHLKKLPVSELKIDKSFVLQMTEAGDDAIIVRSTIDMARNLGLSVVAEGVENGDIMDALAEMGCERVQGYHISRPVASDRLPELLSARRPKIVLAAPSGNGSLRAAAGEVGVR